MILTNMPDHNAKKLQRERPIYFMLKGEVGEAPPDGCPYPLLWAIQNPENPVLLRFEGQVDSPSKARAYTGLLQFLEVDTTTGAGRQFPVHKYCRHGFDP